MSGRVAVWAVLAVIAGGACVHRTAQVGPAPTEHRLDRDAERRNAEERRAWIERMHRTPPDVDWRAVERENARIDQERRNAIGRARGVAGGVPSWREIGSSNLAGRMHAAVIGPDGQTLYAGSALGGLWRADLDGNGWEPLADNLWGGVHEVLVLPGELPGEPDVLVAITDGGAVHVTRDEGLTWEQPAGTAGLHTIRGVALLQDASRTLLLYARGGSTSDRPSVLASTDYGRSFGIRWQGTTGWNGWMWVPRTGAAAANRVYVVDNGQLKTSTDGGFTFPSSTTIATGASRAVLAGSEAGAPTLYAALQVGGQWTLYRSVNAGASWTAPHTITDFWETLAASSVNPALVVYAGVEAHRSTNGGNAFSTINAWWEYYDDPVNRLHADLPGVHCWPDPSAPGQEIWYFSTDGGLFRSTNGGASVENLSLSGLGVSQYYSTLSSAADWDRIALGSQDQGYQFGLVGQQAPLSSVFTQLISGDYGHLTSGNGRHGLVYSTYPGFALIQEGTVAPTLHFTDFPAGALHAWLPPVVADPVSPDRFYFCGDRLYRYDRTAPDTWTPTVHSGFKFGGPGIDGDYLSALAFAPTDPDRAYAVNDAGRLFRSTDHGVSWVESPGPAPPQHYFYGNAITVHPEDPLEVAVGGSGYGNPGVIRSTDGGVSWFAESAGLPSTLVYALAYAEDGSGDLFAGTETGAWRWDRLTGTWGSIMGNEAPATIYWSVEPVNDGGTMRYGTYGRGAWDYALVPGDRDGDGIGDDADVCPNDDDLEQLDADADGRGDACDKCPLLWGASQDDTDDDDAGDACDCAVLDPGVFATPPEVEGLAWPSASLLSWMSAAPESGSDTVHVVLRGTLGAYPAQGGAGCTATTVGGTDAEQADVPAIGTGYWYLVRGTNTCGDGPLGAERPDPGCD